MRKIISAVSKISLASASSIISGIIRTKIFAVVLGTIGVGITSQLLNFNNLVLFLVSAGIPVGVTKYVSEWEIEGKWTEIKEIISKCLLLLISFGLLSFLTALLFRNQVSSLILNSDTYSLLLIIIALSFPFSAALTIFEAFLKGLKKFNQYVKISILISSLTLAINLCFVIFYGVLGFAISLLITSVVNVFVYVFFFSKNKIFTVKEMFKFKFTITEPVKSVLKLGIATLIVGAFDQTILLSIRSLIIKYLGLEINGIYQCVWGISNNYFSIFYMSLGVYILPVLSGMRDTDEMNNEINNTLRLTLLVIVPIIAFAFVLREYMVMVLYTSKFLPATNLMVYNFTGDYFKALSWVLGAWLIPRSKIKLWMILGILYYVYYIIFILLLSFFSIDIKNVVIAYSITNFIHFIVNLYFIRKVNVFQFNSDVIKSLSISSIFLLIILIFSSYNIFMGYFLVVPLFIVWLKFSVKKTELYELFSILKTKIIR